MTSPTPATPDLLRQEILEEARRQSEAVLDQARRTAATIVAKAEAEAEQYRAQRLQAAQAQAKQRAEAILATVPVIAARMRAARIEEVLQSIHDRAGELLAGRTGFDYPGALTRLAEAALGQMSGAVVQLRVTPADLPTLRERWSQEPRLHSGLSRPMLRLVADSNLKDGEVRLEDDSGRQLWDLSLEARLERCWPQLRRQILAQTSILEPDTA